jgi:hypothetical protein
MSLQELVDNTLTDKGSTHSYIELYEVLLQSKKYTAKNVIEIGVGDFSYKNGGSIKLWRDYFINANITAVDILPKERVIDELIGCDKVILHLEKDAYDENFVKTIFYDNNKKFDILLDDGPHTLESMISFIKLYLPLMEDDGILIIEDLPDIYWTQILMNYVPEQLKPFVCIYDLRNKKNRIDDIVFVIDKSR